MITDTLTVIGEVSVTPPDRRLRYRLRDARQEVWLEGAQALAGVDGDPSTFTLTLSIPDALVGAMQLELDATLAQASMPIFRQPRLLTPFPGVQVQLNGIARTARAQVRLPISPSRSWLPLYGLPRHLWIGLDEARPAPTFTPHQRQIIIAPVEAYRALFRGEDAAAFDASLQALRIALQQKPHTLSATITALPISDFTEVLRANVSYLATPDAEGVRWITMFTQEIQPVTANALTYVYQGLSRDGRYFIAGFVPLTNTALPTTPTPLTRDAIRMDYAAYLRQVESTLQINAEQFVPSLAVLDGMFSSLRLEADFSLEQAHSATVRTTDWLNVRVGPSLAARIFERLAPNQAVEVLALSEDGEWARVRLVNGREGWVSAQYLTPRAALSTLPIFTP